MKKIILSVSLLAFIGSTTLFTSCDAIKEKVKDKANIDYDFDFEGATATFELPVMTDLNNTIFPDTIDVPVELAGQISEYSQFVSMDDIQSVTVVSATMELNNSNADNDMSNFESAIIAFYTDSKPEVKWIASNDIIPNTPATKIDLAVAEGINLIDYMKTGSKIYYAAGLNLRKVTTQPLTCTVKIKYHVDFK